VFIDEQILYEGIASVLLLLTPVYMHGVPVCFLVFSFIPCTHVAAKLLCVFSLTDSNICKVCNLWIAQPFAPGCEGRGGAYSVGFHLCN